MCTDLALDISGDSSGKDSSLVAVQLKRKPSGDGPEKPPCVLIGDPTKICATTCTLSCRVHLIATTALKAIMNRRWFCGCAHKGNEPRLALSVIMESLYTAGPLVATAEDKIVEIHRVAR